MDVREMSPAELRREKRRQKILGNSGDRMKKIMGGYSDVPVGLEDHDAWPAERPARPVSTHSDYSDVSAAEMASNRLDELTNPDRYNNQDQDFTPPQFDNIFQNENESGECENEHMDGEHVTSQHIEHTPAIDPKLVQELLKPELSDDLLFRRESSPTKAPVVDMFTVARTLIILFAGIIVRLSFLIPFGDEYVQSIFNPFMALEVAIIGYQISVQMDMGSDVKGGIWLSTLVLVGMKPDVISTYKTATGVLNSIASDFMVYFLAFIITHIVV